MINFVSSNFFGLLKEAKLHFDKLSQAMDAVEKLMLREENMRTIKIDVSEPYHVNAENSYTGKAIAKLPVKEITVQLHPTGYVEILYDRVLHLDRMLDDGDTLHIDNGEDEYIKDGEDDVLTRWWDTIGKSEFNQYWENNKQSKEGGE